MRAQQGWMIVFGILVLCCTREASSFPIRPVWLLELCQTADTIVSGKVIKPIDQTDIESDGVAELRVTAVYKGDVKVGDLVRVTGISVGHVRNHPAIRPMRRELHFSIEMRKPAATPLWA